MKKINTMHIMLITSSLLGCDSQKLNDNSNQLSYANATSNQNSQTNESILRSNDRARGGLMPFEQPSELPCTIDNDGICKSEEELASTPDE
ncbi:MAG: hypothetical protein C4617_03195 [Candidatus Liberibacter europaeus]|uniref:Lipoprotein n=1 Tax=Candidatus Liberibacter europaeus TaxID=744859 RepID=A0A2T4VYG6_9HYPH|nr:hypothetical protein [Candidatus Liberibacter europaeus]PTL86817.1 MAG: hypothetical protein C4617_03195 [Candidatus Liberibacter europaeus]